MSSALPRSIGELRKNLKQWEAFETINEHCVVLAPPGSGKTKLLTTRLAYDLINAIPKPQGAACITFTNPAATQLRQRVEALGVPLRSTVFVGTVHSFALQQIILPFATMFGRDDLLTRSIASDDKCDAARKAAVSRVYGSHGDTRFVDSTVRKLRHQLADDNEWARSGAKIKEVADLYESTLASQGLVDFDQLIAAAVQFVEQHENVRKVLRARHPRLYVDEYQDLAPGLDRIVRALCFDTLQNAQLFAVGDPDQAVYGWLGAKPELLEELADRTDVHDVHLEQNYRSRAEILRVANQLMRRDKVPMVGDREGGSIQAIRCSGGSTGEYLEVVRAVRDFQARGVPLHEIVVVCPWNDHCEQAAASLHANGIPAFVRGSDYRLSEATSFVEACAAWTAHGRETSGYRLYDLLRAWRSALEGSWYREKDVALTRLLMDKANPAKAASQFLQALFDLGLTSSLRRTGREEDLQLVGQMTAALTTGRLRNLTIAGLAERARRSNRVEVATMNSCKGLEFDVVLFVGANEKLVPSFRSTTSAELAEERRKFYVSITRARDEVKILYSGVVTWSNGRRDATGPSRFLVQLGLV